MLCVFFSVYIINKNDLEWESLEWFPDIFKSPPFFFYQRRKGFFLILNLVGRDFARTLKHSGMYFWDPREQNEVSKEWELEAY